MDSGSCANVCSNAGSIRERLATQQYLFSFRHVILGFTPGCPLQSRLQRNRPFCYLVTIEPSCGLAERAASLCRKRINMCEDIPDLSMEVDRLARHAFSLPWVLGDRGIFAAPFRCQPFLDKQPVLATVFPT